MRLVSPGSLTGAEKLVFENLKPWLPPNGVCVNVMLGQDPWDIRPLMLINNKVSLYRFSRPLGQKMLSALAAEIQGFAVIPGWEMKVEARNEAERLLLIRPVYQRTLQDDLAQSGHLTGQHISGQKRQELVSGLIDVVKTLRKRSLVHGHISPANIVDVDGTLILLDPRLGALHYSKDEHLAPEVNSGDEPEFGADLFGLGSVLSLLLGEQATHQQREIIDRLLLPSPRQRPTIEEVEREFVKSLPPQTRTGIRAGKFVKKAGEPLIQPSPKAVGDLDGVEDSKWTPYSWPWFLTLVVCVALGIAVVNYQYPGIFKNLLRDFELFAPTRNPEFELAWASNDKGKMRVVARAALEDHDPAAEDAIIDDTLRGENRPGVAANLLRVALSDLWEHELSFADRRAALALSVVGIYPEAVKTLPPLNSLHAGVILAVAGQSQAKNPSKQLGEIGIERLASLPNPVGDLFGQLKASGTKTLAAPEAIALAGIVSGNPPAETLEAYIGSDSSLPVSLARVALALPLFSANEATATQLLAILRDRGGEIGQTLSWFDIDALGVWSKVKSAERLRLILGELPDRDLSVLQYADLLTFPLAEVRAKSAEVIRARFLKSESSQLMLVLGGEQNRFTREQTIALVAALSLDVSKRAPYVGVFFRLMPSPDMVLLLLLARSDKDSSDLFNLEAARYLRKNTRWTATTEMLQLLAHHPEPLARSLAYARLTARDPAQKTILQQRLSEEGEPGLLKSITSKLTPPNNPLPIGTPVPYVSSPGR